jgi:hypothetical protein
MPTMQHRRFNPSMVEYGLLAPTLVIAGTPMMRVITYAIIAALMLYTAATATLYLLQDRLFIINSKFDISPAQAGLP